MSEDKTILSTQNNQDTVVIAPLFEIDHWINDLKNMSANDPLAPFQPLNLTCLARLFSTDRAKYESLRKDLSKCKVDVKRLEAAVKQEKKNVAAPGAQNTQSNFLISLADDVEFFHDKESGAYAGIASDRGHTETWPVNSKGFNQWLTHKYYKSTGNAPSADALKSALATLSAKAVSDGKEKEVYLRVASCNAKIYIDLCDKDWRVIEVDKTGYRVLDKPTVHFVRKKGMLPLPLPEAGGHINELKRFVNVKGENGFILTVSWLLMALRGQGPFPILILIGEQGTAKSTLTTILRRLVDPNSAALRTLPQDVRDLYIAAKNGWVLAFDNLSRLFAALSDALCRLSTGGGFATRTLFTDDEEALFDAVRPILMNGIENVGTRGDLADRSMIMLLEQILEQDRTTESELYNAFKSAHPRIFGALLDMLVHGLQNHESVALKELPRMADFAIWATACETKFWPSGSFMAAYAANRAEANEDVIAASPVATAIIELLEAFPSWKGTAGALMGALTSIAENEIKNNHVYWPKTPKVLSEQVRRLAPALRLMGVIIKYYRENGARIIELSRNDNSDVSVPAVTTATEKSQRSNSQRKRRKF